MDELHLQVMERKRKQRMTDRWIHLMGVNDSDKHQAWVMITDFKQTMNRAAINLSSILAPLINEEWM
jgi:hypothetical protein